MAEQGAGEGPMGMGSMLKEVQDLAEKYSKSVAQVVLRWDLQKGIAVIPKSSRQERVVANADLFDFELAPDDVALIDSMDVGKRFGPDPDDFRF